MNTGSHPRSMTRRCPSCQVLVLDGGPHLCVYQGGEDDPAPKDELIGVTLDGRFQIEQRLGGGGMATIYRARHIHLNKLVAVKVLREAGDEVARRRFLQEARSASSLRHSNIVDISDFGVLADGQPYLVMELLEGQTLGQLMAQGPLEAARACRIAAQIAHALQVVHTSGIVHRDLKPDNVLLLEREGHKDFVKILDFGVAKVVAGPRLTRTGMGPLRPGELTPPEEAFTHSDMVLGTPEYMAPEQATRQEIDHRADQYALGCILYEMLTGSLPFNDPDPEMLLLRHVTETVIPPRERRPDLDIPAALEAVVLRALAKGRSERFPAMRDLEQALRAQARLTGPGRGRWLGELLTLARAASGVLPADGWRRMAAFALIGGLGGAIFLVGLRSGLHRPAGPGRRPPPGLVAPAAAGQMATAPARPGPPPGAPGRTVSFAVPAIFVDGVKLSCAPHIERRCVGRCSVELPGDEGRCVASYPGYRRKAIRIDLHRTARAQDPITENLFLLACTMAAGEDCEPAGPRP